MSPERQLDDYIAKWAIQALARWMLTVAIVLGLLIVLGGKQRFTGISYSAALKYPYAPESWGIILGTFGIVGLTASLCGKLKVVAVALFGQAVWSLFFAYSFADTALHIPVAGTTGPAVYVGIAVATALIGVVHWKSGTLVKRAHTTDSVQTTPTSELARRRILALTSPRRR